MNIRYCSELDYDDVVPRLVYILNQELTLRRGSSVKFEKRPGVLGHLV
jgi:hypothetical protein